MRWIGSSDKATLTIEIDTIETAIIALLQALKKRNANRAAIYPKMEKMKNG